MVNDSLTAERGLALGYAPDAAQPGLAALLALDTTLGGIVRSTSQPLVGQMRLTWWHDALAALATAPPPAEPVLQGIATHVVPAGVAGTDLAVMIDAWEVLLDDPSPDDAAIALFGQRRGGVLFAAAATVCGGGDGRIADLGAGWALADLAAKLRDGAAAARAGQAAARHLAAGLTGTLPRRLRALGALAVLARADLAGTAPGSPSRVGRLLLHRLTGR
ncbi:hypothetical protein ASE75_08045 [Sphingomonas sp. Leaf17]|uniref:squalene/phytoene synthase family protein n=1 Tax=Sphingomonas sp. Leaf17 TaxID=1735683 RepID=UPI0006FB540B|nr:squalene/phytoene synthase family protein [Sphingomonas sp. Leaf17]KQM64997.1 hypothetical protein ASE75_08045 [Sphingomonas sp. Leaf17]